MADNSEIILRIIPTAGCLKQWILLGNQEKKFNQVRMATTFSQLLICK
jgi:hypothetical protein